MREAPDPVRRSPTINWRPLKSLVSPAGRNHLGPTTFVLQAGEDADETEDIDMGFGRGALLWLIGVPIPVIVLIALLWHH